MSNVLTVRLPPGVKARFAAHCARVGTTSSAAIRTAVTAEVADVEQTDTAAPVPAARSVEVPDEGPKSAVRLWLTPTEREAVDGQVEHAGGSRASWIVRAVRGALTAEPQLGDEELRVLGESNRELLAIGRNLNQIARRLNERQKQQSVEAEMLERLSRQIHEHVDQVHQVMRANRERWRLR